MKHLAKFGCPAPQDLRLIDRLRDPPERRKQLDRKALPHHSDPSPACASSFPAAPAPPPPPHPRLLTCVRQLFPRCSRSSCPPVMHAERNFRPPADSALATRYTCCTSSEGERRGYVMKGGAAEGDPLDAIQSSIKCKACLTKHAWHMVDHGSLRTMHFWHAHLLWGLRRSAAGRLAARAPGGPTSKQPRHHPPPPPLFPRLPLLPLSPLPAPPAS